MNILYGSSVGNDFTPVRLVHGCLVGGGIIFFAMQTSPRLFYKLQQAVFPILLGFGILAVEIRIFEWDR